MIKSNSYSKEWILSKRTKKNKIDPTLCEKMIRALGLLEQLVLNKLDFVFKGGTSLILLIDNPQRFSIDIDINSEIDKNSLELILNKVMSSGIFKRYEENKRIERGIPKAHYKFFFDSVINTREDYVLLDVLFHKHSYPETIQTPIKSMWIDTDQDDIFVKTPTIDAILGDKLTAFAPNTTGIPYNAGKEMEIIKQLFDVGRLFDLSKNFDVIAKSFNAVADKEIKFREGFFTREDVLNDIIKTSLLIAQLPKNKTPEQKEFIKGLKKFKTYPIGVNYRNKEVKISSAKASYLASKIINKDYSPIERYESGMNLKPNAFEKKYNYLNKLKKPNPEAYFYWMKVMTQSNRGE